MERNLGGLKPIKRWLEDNWCENLYERMDYRTRFEAKSLVTECNNFAKIVSGIFGQEDTLMEILAKYHDVGKFAQYRLLGFEDDQKLSHNALGLDSLDRFIELNEIKITPEIQILRDVIYYHGRKISQKAKLSENSIKYVEQISIIEVFTMECIRDLVNLERIAEKDVRRYNKEFPEYIGKVREEIYTFFRNEDFRERRFFLKSYAEEVLVSVMKAIRLMREYGSTLQKAMTVPNYYYASALAGYSAPSLALKIVCPFCGLINPKIIRKMVVFPSPLGPIRAMISPGFAAKLLLFKTSFSST